MSSKDKLTYIYHDGFVLDTPEAAVVFDYWKDPEAADPRFLKELDPRKPLYVLVTHHHKDHFNPEIFQWSDQFEDTHYILSRDTYRAARHFFTPGSLYKGLKRVNPEKVSDLAPGGVYADDRISIRAFGSTDLGNSYMVEVDGKRVFHAGDLNAWVWKDDSTQQEIDEAMAHYDKVLDTISSVTDSFDLAMFPADPRLGTDFWTGAYVFVRRFDVGIFVPMHFTLAEQPDSQLDYIAQATDFRAYANPDRGRYVALTTPGASLEF